MTNKKKTAIIYCEDQFAEVDGKTAAGLIRHSEIYSILGVIDSSLAGKDAGEVLDGEKNNIPIFNDLKDALKSLGKVPSYYIYGKAPLEASIPENERLFILEAMKEGMNIVNGLHQFFSEDPEFTQMAAKCDVQIRDIRKSPIVEDLHVFTGMISKIDVPVIAVLGTDCACGKMTTAVELNNTLNAMGIKSVMIATGQTSLMQGSKYGASIDALVSQFVIGEIENAVVQAFENENPDIIIVEGQSSVSHPAFMSSIGILKGSMPDGVILQHAPARKFRVDFPDMEMPTVRSEIQMIEAISQTQVIAIALSHEGINDVEVLKFIEDYEERLALPTTDVLKYGTQKLIQMLSDRFPTIYQKIKAMSLESIPAEDLLVPERLW
ncbi:MAG: DUF1611 domain-containing protein [Chloroflexi bacterium]|jgi:uncharacterized NAD-dependent epimerase/dehydratase family protein|nr:DUF1611 domain-containing protein [Chloroflexota bacterium]MBT4306605.1 DUF1611 domain-containing protein [Chloroflexota bacterium]MBT4533872.1 DUF1611 domain-containing protein [Chloroflexota bacterium]MBT4681878.1 DUF1611 domain-containing protein [Chloroflexota bacterium]MBT4755232.1 DUF1611 domain-containing protein [Chloroflexota bacterium]